MYEITNRTAAPYKSICYIVCTWSDGGAATRGSGVVVGLNDVLTAAHVVYDARRGGYATSITISPAADVSPLVQPYGTFSDVGNVNTRTDNWDTNGDGLLYDSESQYDLALLGLRSAIGNVTGWLNTSPLATDFYGVMAGYPARGSGLMAEDIYADASSSASVFDIMSGLGAGASGGPLLRTDGAATSVVGVLSAGNRSNTSSTYAGLFGAGNWEWLAGAMAANDGVIINSTPSAGLPAGDDYAATTATTGVLAAGIAQGGVLETATDVDWFRISVTAGSYRFEARGSSSGDGTLTDPVVKLYNASGTLLRTDDDSGTGTNASLTYAFTVPGTYYVAVTSPDGAFGASGTYRVLATSLTPTASAPVILTGTAGDDTLVGTAADETLRGLQGNDQLNGMAGTDTAAYTGRRADYRLFNTGDAISVTDNTLSRDGIDRLTGIERVAFADMTVNLQVGANSRTIAPAQLTSLLELYLAFFNRVPDADGLAYWIDQTRAGQALGSIAEAFYSAALQYPALTGYTAAMSHADFVNVIYRNVLGRTEGADAEGLAYWTSALASGAQSRGALVGTILASAHTFKGHVTYGHVADLLDNKAAVAQAFAVDMGLNYNTAEASISQGMAIAAAVTAASTAAAISLIGVTDGFTL